jgi:hypothetical protein
VEKIGNATMRIKWCYRPIFNYNNSCTAEKPLPTQSDLPPRGTTVDSPVVCSAPLSLVHVCGSSYGKRKRCCGRQGSHLGPGGRGYARMRAGLNDAAAAEAHASAKKDGSLSILGPDGDVQPVPGRGSSR